MRPARFTVIAVLNFCFGALSLLVIIGTLNAIPGPDPAPEPPATVMWVNLLVIALNVTLMIAGGVGLLLVRKWGWALCLAYGILAVVWNLIWGVVAGMSPVTVVAVIYPVVVVSLLLSRVSREAIV